MIENICSPTKSSPALLYNSEERVFKIEGISTLVNAIEFFDLATAWINLNEHRLETIEFQFHLPYFNSASMKGIMLLMQRIQQGIQMGRNWRIAWNVEDDDEFLLDAAESFQEMIGVDIRIIRD